MKKPKELNVVTVDRTEKENNTTTRYKQCSLRPISNKKMVPFMRKSEVMFI